VGQRLENPDRFVLMFAPITRSYRSSFADATVPTTPLAEYKRNQLAFPKDVGVNIQYLRAWQEQFKGDAFDFDYHMIWACHHDLSNVCLARVLHRDLQSLDDIGLRGFNSCQVQRMAFPHNLLLDVLARTLWDKTTAFDDILQSTFAVAYGVDDGPRMIEFFSRMSELWSPFFDAVYIPEPDDARIAQAQANIGLLRDLAVDIRPVVARNLDHPTAAIRCSWQYACFYLELLEVLLPAFESYLHADADQTRARFQTVFDWAWKHEKDLHEALDVDMLVRVLSWRLNEIKEATA